jgi:CDP-diacylglycerol--glycerol-3-phosphate 3-phosphatidyltransferase
MPTTLYQLKPAFQTLLRPATLALWRSGVTANQVTVSAAVLSVTTGVVMATYSPHPRVLLLLAPVLLLRMALNAIDGVLAREFGLESRSGAILNELGDVISDTALYLPLALGWGFSPTLITLVVIAAVISEMTGVLCLATGTRHHDGPMGKSDRAFIFGVASLAIGFGVPAGAWQNIVLEFILFLLVITIANRARGALLEGQ